MPDFNAVYTKWKRNCRIVRDLPDLFPHPQLLIISLFLQTGLVFVSSDLCYGFQSVAFSLDDFGIFGSLYNLINCSRQAKV